jgi:hypothetical protein
MDFKSLLNKLDSMEAPPTTPAAPTIAGAVHLNEDAQLRVLSGRSTYVAEKQLMESAALAEVEKLDEYESKNGKYVHKGTRGADYDGSAHDDKESKAAKTSKEKEGDRASDAAEEKKGKEWEKAHGKGSVTRVKDGKKVESVETPFKSKFAKMVEEAKADKEDKKAMAAKAKKEKKMDEGSKPDFLDVDKDGDKKEPMKKAAKEKGDAKSSGKKGMSAKQEKFFGKKKAVKESVEFGSLSFRDMLQLVQESGGQQQIDPVDKTLFAWAERVAKSKFQESTKAEVYAGLVYERMGGKFEMYDVLSETRI